MLWGGLGAGLALRAAGHCACPLHGMRGARLFHGPCAGPQHRWPSMALVRGSPPVGLLLLPWPVLNSMFGEEASCPTVCLSGSLSGTTWQHVFTAG